MTDQQPEKRKIHDLAVVACAGTGVGTGTGLLLGSPMYTMAVIEDRAFNRRGEQRVSDNADALALGALGFILGGYLVQKSTRWLYERIYG